jgi:hypothetical protein
MYGQNHFPRRLIHIGDDVCDERAQELLSRPCGDTWSIPSGIEIISEPDKIRRDDLLIGGQGSRQSCLA